MSNSRDLAIRILSRVESDNAYISVLLDAEFRKSPSLDPRDRALVTELVYGVIRWRKTLDWYLDQVCKKPMRKTHPWLRQVLRLGAYQLLMLDKIPPSAAINETVKLAGTYSKKLRLPAKTAKGFVNAALRELERNRKTLKSPDTLPDAITRFATKYSYPEWMVKRWVRRLGEKGAEDTCHMNNQPPSLTFRVNTLKASLADVRRQLAANVNSVTPLPGNLSGLAVSGARSVSDLPCYQKGLCTVQNASSILISLILDPSPGENILDACSGSGTKTTHIAERMKNRGNITAVDIHKGKLQQLKENCRRLGVTIVQTSPGDMTTSLDLPGYEYQGDRGFHRILIDAPCSGLGVLRKQPEAKWTKDETHIAELQQLQLHLLTHAATLLHPDRGVLVYSACTTEPEENEEVIEKFLRSVKGFQIESPLPYIPEELHRFITPKGFLRIEPPQEYFDGFFCARLSRI